MARPEDLHVDGHPDAADPILQTPTHRRTIIQSPLALAGGAVAGFLLRHLSAQTDRRQLTDKIKELQGQLADEEKKRERRVGPEPGITWQVVGWNVLVPVDDLNRYRKAHPTHPISITLTGPHTSITHREINTTNEEPADRDPLIKLVGDVPVYVFSTWPSYYYEGVPANFYVRITDGSALVDEKQESVPLEVFHERHAPDANPYVFSDEDPTRGVDQGTLDDIAAFAHDLRTYNQFSANVFIRASLAPGDPAFSERFLNLFVSSQVLKDQSNADANYYKTMRALSTVVFESFPIQRTINNELLFPGAANFQRASLSGAFDFSAYVPSASDDDRVESLSGRIAPQKLADIVTILRFFPDRFLQKFSELPDREKELARKNVTGALEVLTDVVGSNRSEMNLNALIPNLPLIGKVVGV